MQEVREVSSHCLPVSCCPLGTGNAASHAPNPHPGHWCLAGINWAKPRGSRDTPVWQWTHLLFKHHLLHAALHGCCHLFLLLFFPFPVQPDHRDWDFYTGALGWGLERPL